MLCSGEVFAGYTVRTIYGASTQHLDRNNCAQLPHTFYNTQALREDSDELSTPRTSRLPVGLLAVGEVAQVAEVRAEQACFQRGMQRFALA